ncbi:MAG: hypothetical protein LBL65_08285 [Campylobacteraceae bacterium]|jgi:hypothetical protein|nr:hypothetical protein [Campylobacteraceae bacterium]
MKTGVTLSVLKLLFISILGIVFLTGCRFEGFFGKGNSTAAPVNASTPIISVQPVSAVYVQGDAAIPLEIMANVNDGGVLSYQWYSNGINSNENGSIISEATSQSYVPLTSDIGTTYYYAVVTNTNDNAKKEKRAFVVSDAAGIEVNALSASFYDADLNLLAKYGNLSFGHEVELNSNKTAYNITDWYLANNDTAVDFYTIANKSVNFYASSNVTEITSQNDLAYINTDNVTLAGKYILLNDIKLDENGAGFDDDGWKPIGNPSNSFTGIFNGNSHKITNLWINRPSAESIGFFGYAENATMKNIGVEITEGKSITGNDSVGGIVGQVVNTNITYVYSIGNVGGDSHVGGIAGSINNGSITNTYSTGNIEGIYFDIGGIVGVAMNGSVITNVYSTRNVSGYGYVGGIAGSTRHIDAGSTRYSNIVNTYSIGDVNGNSFVGSIVGYADHGNITNTYSRGNINSANVYIGGIMGWISNSDISNNAVINGLIAGKNDASRVVGFIGSDINLNIVSNNFVLDSIVGTFANIDDTRYHGIDKTIEQLKTKETYSDAVNGDGLGGLGWKFGDNIDNPWVWGAFDDYPYPTLYWQTQKP